MTVLSVLHSLFGWIYFVAWSACFWPQVLLNHRRQTTSGLSPDFVALNILGFVAYAIFTFASLFDNSVTASYEKYAGYAPQVELNDAFFAAHGAFICTVLAAQSFTYPPRIAPHRYTTVSVIVTQTLIVIGLFGCMSGLIDWYPYLRFNGAVKVISSIIKHIPQVYSNYHRSSTVGFSFTLVLLDVVGSVFSLAQQALRSVMEGNLTPFTGNLAKTTLAGEALLFDIYFILQHVCFYPDHTDVDVLSMKRKVEQKRADAQAATEALDDGETRSGDARDLERLLHDGAPAP
eukprot:TRINITY_DN78828_c0_g1_i1.p1 TRINITY_DN78828_c0_g1~~TRINITY_DN78828_c0_g1_i1.p1  ORF type:complete len:290 (-),score=37.85 TRINITY_DN78828_c0_g1_i1:350-1219(-)